MVGFLGLSCVFALAGVLFGGLGFPGRKLPETGTPAKAKALFGGLEVSQAGVLVCGGCVSWAYGLAGCGILVKASLVSGRDLAAYLLSLVSIWRTLLSQGEYWFKTRVQA